MLLSKNICQLPIVKKGAQHSIVPPGCPGSHHYPSNNLEPTLWPGKLSLLKAKFSNRAYGSGAGATRPVPAQQVTAGLLMPIIAPFVVQPFCGQEFTFVRKRLRAYTNL